MSCQTKASPADEAYPSPLQANIAAAKAIASVEDEIDDILDAEEDEAAIEGIVAEREAKPKRIRKIKLGREDSHEWILCDNVEDVAANLHAELEGVEPSVVYTVQIIYMTEAEIEQISNAEFGGW